MDEINLISPDPRPTRADAVKNHDVLLRTAQRLFDEAGVEAVTMTQIAQEAGVGKGTLYRHFNNKNELCQALLDEDMRSLQVETLNHARANDDPLGTLRWFLGAVVRFVIRNEDMLFAGLDTTPNLSMELDAHLWWRQTIRGFLRQMQVEGDLDYLTDVLYIMLDVNTIRFQHRTRGYEIERIIAGLHDTLDRLRFTPR